MAIIGAGPAGCTLACLLALRGMKPIVFDDDKRPELLVGESLIPSVIPVLRKLGIEDGSGSFPLTNPAHLFSMAASRGFTSASWIAGKKHRATPITSPDHGSIPCSAIALSSWESDSSITGEAPQISSLPIAIWSSRGTLEAAGLTAHPDWLIDGTGRSRLFARTLDLPATRGGRNDVAYFAHFENFDHDDVDPGQVIISVLKNGWSWRIPLPGRLSVGIVIDKDSAKKIGNTPTERLEASYRRRAILREKGTERQTRDRCYGYTNYQLIS